MISFVCFLLAVVSAAFAARSLRAGRRRLAMILAGAAALSLVIVVLFGPRSYELVKTIGTMLMPAGFVWLILLAVMALAIVFRRVSDAAVLGSVVVLYLIAGSSLLGASLIRSLESSFDAPDDPFSEKFDVVHVLGGGTYTHHGTTYLGSSGGRVTLGARLYNRGNTPLLLTTGSTPPNWETRHDSASATRDIWLTLGVPEDVIMAYSDPHDTEDELALLADLARANGWQHIGLVTSARHMPRALNLAERNGIHVIPIPSDFIGPRAYFGFRSFIPTGAGFQSMHAACWEYLGRIGGQ